MKWIIENQEWLFSGVAIAVPLAIIGWFLASKKQVQKQKSGSHSTNIQITGGINIGKPDKND
jgi:predicted negative regulator of RcsB-dependent stress response